MFGHMPELLIIVVLALIVFGPEKLPEVASSVGKAVREVRSALDTAMHPEDHEVPEDFSTYYYESLSRSEQSEPEEDVPEGEEPWHYSIEGMDGEDEPGLEPIPIRADRPDVYPDDPDFEAAYPEHAPEEADAAQVDRPAEAKSDNRPTAS